MEHICTDIATGTCYLATPKHQPDDKPVVVTDPAKARLFYSHAAAIEWLMTLPPKIRDAYTSVPLASSAAPTPPVPRFTFSFEDEEAVYVKENLQIMELLRELRTASVKFPIGEVATLKIIRTN